jgi:hypothetical protein
VDETDDQIPEHVARFFLAHDREALGEFLICPFAAQKPGVMQPVRLIRARHMRVVPAGQG